MVVRRFFVCILFFMAGACQSEQDAKLEQLKSDLDLVQANLRSCEDAATELEREQGKISQAEWDVAAAKDMNSIDPEQEQEIRESLGDQMGIAPSRVDWKGIYESRAKAGKAKLERKNYALDLAQEQVSRSCASKAKDQQQAWRLEDEIKRLGGVV
jgi:hypothetical protein